MTCGQPRDCSGVPGLIPFLVVDRPASLRIIAGLELPTEELRLGLMTHANTTERFGELFRNFPCGEPDYCKKLHQARRHPQGLCSSGRQFASYFEKIGDSGVFNRDGCHYDDYPQLFRKYATLGVDFGIMADVLKDSERTIESARRGFEAYSQLRSPSFQLVGVAQGNSVREYLRCYTSLRRIGYNRIAIGGLLRKKEKSKHFVHVRDEHMMYDVLRAIRLRYPADWLFALGAYHPKRHNRLAALGIFGGDYKGWIFHYSQQERKRVRRLEDRRRYRQVRQYLLTEVVSRILGTRGNSNLLVLGCSRAKVRRIGELPAIQLYDGPTFRMVRNLFFDGLHLDVDLAIFSGKHGLIMPSVRLQYYNKRLEDSSVSNPLVSTAIHDLASEVRKKKYKEVFLSMGSDYAMALCGFPRVGSRVRVLLPSGPIGKRLAQTKRWLVSKSNRGVAGIYPASGAFSGPKPSE